MLSGPCQLVLMTREHEQLYIGQLAVIGRHGVEKTVPLELNDAEKAAYHNSVQAIENNYQRVQ